MATVQYDTKTGAKLSAGQSTIVNGVSVMAGSTYNAPSSGGSSGGGGGSSVINIDSNPSQTLAPGQVYTYQGQTYTQPGGATNPAPTPAPTPSIVNTYFNTAANSTYTSSGGFTYKTDANGIPTGNPISSGNGTTAPTLSSPVTTTVPNPVTPPTLPPVTTDPNASYYAALTQQVTNLQKQIDTQRQQQLDQLTQQKNAAQTSMDNANSNEQNTIAAESKAKLDQITLEENNFNTNYNIVQVAQVASH